MSQVYQPIPVSDVYMAFPGDVDEWIPPRELWQDIDYNHGSGHLGVKLFDDLFHTGGVKEIDLKPKEGIDANMAARHIKTLMGTYSTKHEDKIRMCAYLFDLWFDLPGSSWKKA